MKKYYLFLKILQIAIAAFLSTSSDLSIHYTLWDEPHTDIYQASLISTDTVHVSNDHLTIQTGSKRFPYGDFETAVDNTNEGGCINFLIDHDRTYPISEPLVITKRITFTNRGHRTGILLPILGPREVTIE